MPLERVLIRRKRQNIADCQGRLPRVDKKFLIQNCPLFSPFGNRTAVRIRLQDGGRRIFFKRRSILLGQDIFLLAKTTNKKGKTI